MKHLEEEFNKRFNKDQISYDHSEAEELWIKIDEKLKPESKRPLALLFLSITLLILMISFATFSFYKSRSIKVASNIKSDQNYNDQDKDVQSLENIEDTKMSTANIFSDENKNKNRPKNVRNDVLEKINLDTGLSNGQPQISNIRNDQNGKKETQPSYIIKGKETLKSPITKKHGNIPQSDIKGNQWANTHEEIKGGTALEHEPLKTLDKSSLATINKSQSTFLRETNQSLNPIPSDIKPLWFSREILLLDVSPQTILSDRVLSSSSVTMGVALYSALQKTDISFNGTDEKYLSQLKNTNTGLWTSSQELELKLGINNWSISSGFRLQNMKTRFNYESTILSKILKNDQLVKIIIDSESMDTIDMVFKDTLVNRSTYRKVVHHNNLRQYSIPLRIGYQLEKGKMVLGMEIGLIGNWAVPYKGVNLVDIDTVADYSTESVSMPFKILTVGSTIKPYVRYNLNSSIGISMFSEWQNQNHNTGISVDRTLTQWGMGLGLHYNL